MLCQITPFAELTKLFYEAKPHPRGRRSNFFGAEDELRVAPKGVNKRHPLVPFLEFKWTSGSPSGSDIGLLKCRSLTVVHK